MLTSTLRLLQQKFMLMLLVLFMGLGVSAQDVLMSQSFENAGAMPAGWAKTVVSGSDALTFETTSTYPSGFSAYDGAYMVKFASFSYSSAENRLYSTVPFSTVGKDNVTVNFAWLESVDYETDLDRVTVQWSTDGTTWTDDATFNRAGTTDAWTLKSTVLPDAVENQPVLYLAFLFTSEYGNNCYLDDVEVLGTSTGGDPVTVEIGTGTTAVSYPFYTVFEDSRTQLLYSATEIAANGGVAGDILSIAFNVSSFNTEVLNGFNIDMQNYSGSTTSSWVSSGWTNVYSGTEQITANGWKTFTLQTPFEWDGTSNLLVSVCYDNDDWSGNSSVYGTDVTGTVYHYHTDGSTGCSMTGSSSVTARPNVKLIMETPLVLPTGTLTGYVTNFYGVPVAGATVVANNENGTFTTTSGPNGAYTMDPSVGIYTIGATKEGYNLTTVNNVIVYQATTTYQNIALTQPSMAITPNPYSVTVNPNEMLDGAFNINNNGNGPLGWTASIEYLEPTNAPASTSGPGAFEGMNQVQSFGPESMIQGGNGEALSSRDLMECPEGSKFSLPPVGSDNGYTSGGSYKCYQQFSGVEGSFSSLTFWAIFTSAPPATMNFTVDVCETGAQPGAVAYSIPSIDVAAVATGVPVIGYQTYQFTVEFPESVSMETGYIGIKCNTASPTFYWLNSYTGTGLSFQHNGSSYVALTEYLAMCLGGANNSGWLTLGQYEGTVPAFTNFNLPAYFSAEDMEPGTYQANVTFTSDPNVGTVVVPVTMVVAGEPLAGPENLSAVLTNPIEGLVNLTWSYTPASGFLNFIVKRDGVSIGTTTGNSMSDDLPTYGVYNYTVQAVYAEGASVPAGPVELEWANPDIFVDPTYIYDEVWVNQTATQTVTINNNGEGTLAFSFPDWVDGDNGNRAPLAYCTASGGCDEYIGSVQLNTINNSSGCSQYADYTSIVTELEIGEPYTITVTNPVPYSSDIVGVYIDFNHNESFTDAGEYFSTQSSGGGASFTGTIIVPEDAMSGPTRMRVRLQYGGTMSSCGTSSYGEVEDYTVDIGLPGFITAVVPAQGTIPSGGSKTVTITWDATDFDPGFSYFEDLVLESNDLDTPVVTITNEMYVYTPAQFAGTVTDITTGEPLNGVVVTAMPNGTFETYILDDGTYENGFGYNSGDEGRIGNIYNTTDEGYLTRVDAYFYSGAAMTSPVSIEIYDVDHNLLGVSEPQIINNVGWYTFTLPNIPFTGTFYAMAYYTTVTGGTRYIGWDDNGPNASANLSYELFENAWSTFQSFGYNGVLQIRPTAFVTGEATPITYSPANAPKHESTLATTSLSGNAGMRGLSNVVTRDLTSFQTTTDDEGEYSLFVDPGIYNVSFEKTGYQTLIVEDTTALQGVVTPLDAQLREESYPPSFVYAEVNDDDTQVLVTWGDGSGPYEVIYDDGSAENYAAWAIPGNMNGVKFTPAAYPATVVGGKIYVGDGSFPNNNTGFLGTNFGAMVIDDDGTNGLPGTVLDSISVEVTNYGWLSFSGLNAEITDGSFYLVMVQGTFSPNTAPIGVDQENPIVYRSYSRNVGAGMDWALSPYQDFMMRAVIFGSPADDNTTLTADNAIFRAPAKQRGLLSQSPAMAAAGGVEGNGIFKAALDFNDGSRALTGYRVVRFANFDPDNSPETGTVTGLANNVQGNEYTDNAWANLPAGWYAYGVAANYPNNYISDTVVSNIVGHHIDGTVTVNVALTTGTSPEGAFISLTGLEYPYEVYSATVPADGQVIFEEVWFGQYEFHAEKVGFDDYDMLVTVNGNEVINIILAEKKYKPRNLYVDPLTLVATWDEPLAIAVIEDFEGATFPPAGWQATTQNTTGWYATTNGSSSSWTIPSHTKYAVTNDDADNGNGCCDYLITPEMDWTGLPSFRLNFASFFDGSYMQSAYVEISTDAGASWTVINTLAPAPGAWVDIEIDLAQYSGATGLESVWLAFHADDNGEWASGWAIDDVQISSGGVPLQGYGVFLDGTLVGNTPERTYTYTNLTYGREYLAGVAALYSSGYSELDTYLFRSLYLIPPTNLAGNNPQGTDYVHLTWEAPVVPTVAPNMDNLTVTTAQPSADVATVVNAHTFPQRSIPLSANREILFDNGPLVNSPGTGSGGADESILQTSLGMGTYGSGMQQTAGNSVADDFEVTGTWNLENFEFFGYQTGSTTTSTFTGVFYRIWDGNPTAGGTVIYGDLTTNRLVSTEWSNIYRNDNGPGGSTDRPVMRIIADASDVTLQAGVYWVEWTTTGSLSSGPWVPAVTIEGQTTTGNALQNQSGTWVALTDVGPQGMPFIVNGSGGGGGQTVANLLGYNIYRDDAMIAYVEKPALEYFDLNLDPGTYTYHITAVYDLEIYGYPGQTGESMIEGPIDVNVIYGYDLPFIETWNTGVFTTNEWTVEGTNWQIAGQEGNPLPSAEFVYNPVQVDYDLSMSSYWLNGASFVDGSIYMDFDIRLDDNTATGEEQMLAEVYNGSSWIPVATITAEGDTEWESQHINITNAAKGKVFRIRFTAKGLNTLDINKWQIDNIHVYRLCDAPTNLVAELPDPENHGDQILVTWEAPNAPPVGPAGWLNWDDGTNIDAIGLQGGGTFLVGVRFTPAQLAEYAGTSLTKIRMFPYAPNGSIVLKVWTGANASQLMLSQPIASYNPGTWNEFALTTPVLVSGTTELWFGYEITHDATNYVAGIDGGPAVAGYGDMISLDGSVWESMATAYGLDGNWNLQGYVETVDGVVAMQPIAENSQINNTGAQLVRGNYPMLPTATVAADNSGSRELTGYDVYRRNSEAGEFELIATVTETEYLDTDPAISNLGDVYCYAVKAVYTDCESDFSNEDCETIVTTGELELSAVNVYPNPSNSVVNIELTNNISQIAIYNYVGQVVYEQVIAKDKNIQIDVRNYDAGAYLIKFTTKSGESFTKKVAVTK